MRREKKNIKDLFDNFQDKEMEYNPDSWKKMEELLDQHIPAGSNIIPWYQNLMPHFIGIGIILSLFIGYFIVPESNNNTQANNIVEDNKNTENKNEAILLWVAENTNVPEVEEQEIKANQELFNSHFNTKNTKEYDAINQNAINNKINSNKNLKKVGSFSPIQKEKIKTLEEEKNELNEKITHLKEQNKTDFVKELTSEDVIEVIKGKTSLLNIASKEIMDEIKLDNKVFAQNKETGLIYEKHADTVIKYNIMEKQNTKLTAQAQEDIIKDTVYIVKVERITFVPLPLNKQIEIFEEIKNEKLKEIASLKNNHEFILANKSKTSYSLHEKQSKSTKISDFLQKHFNENKPQYAYLLFGGNILLNKRLGGMHVGIGIGHILDEKWVWNAEFKYTQQFLGQLGFTDTQASFETTKRKEGENWHYEGYGTKMNHNYTINKIQNLNLNTYFSYYFNDRISAQMGIQGNWNFPKSYTLEKEIKQLNVNHLSEQFDLFADQNLLLNPEKDFSSSFSLGYLVGLQYDLNKKWSVQAKMTHPVIHSHLPQLDYLRKMATAPTVELSIGFYFGRKDKVIYIIDNNKK